MNKIRVYISLTILIILLYFALPTVFDGIKSVMTNDPSRRNIDLIRYDFSDPVVVEFVNDIYNGDVIKVKKAIESGVNVNAAGISDQKPIHFIFINKNADVLKLLLAAGADPMTRTLNGRTILHAAVTSENPDFTEALLAAKADPNAVGYLNEPVIFSALVQYHETPNPKIITLLVNAGANINQKWENNTPITLAMTNRFWKMATTLVDLNADLTIKYDNDMTPISKLCQVINYESEKFSISEKQEINLLFKAIEKRNVKVPCQSSFK